MDSVPQWPRSPIPAAGVEDEELASLRVRGSGGSNHRRLYKGVWGRRSRHDNGGGRDSGWAGRRGRSPPGRWERPVGAGLAAGAPPRE